MKSLKSLILISVLTLGSGNAISATLEISDVEKLNSLWADSFVEGNTTGLLSLYTKDAIVFPPSSEILDNPASIKSYLEGLKQVGFNEYSISNVDLDIKGDTAYETALWEVTRVGNNGEAIVLEGNLTNVLEKQENGSWRIKLQSWN